MRYWLLAVIIVIALPREVEAQCVVYKVITDGKVNSESKDIQVLVQVHANRGNKNSEAVAAPEGDRFHIEVGFDTFVSVHFFGAHNCSRRPTGVDVFLLVGGAAKQTVRLSLKDDFTFDEKLDEWHTKTPVVLNEHGAASSVPGAAATRSISRTGRNQLLSGSPR